MGRNPKNGEEGQKNSRAEAIQTLAVYI